jgi:hypothetical protein
MMCCRRPSQISIVNSKSTRSHPSNLLWGKSVRRRRLAADNGMFRSMGSKVSTDRIVKVLPHRGRKALAEVLSRCWLELVVHDAPVMHTWGANMFVHAPLEEYEYLRALPSDDSDLFDALVELYSTKDYTVTSISFALEMDESKYDELITALEEQKSLMISVATGERQIKDANEEYKKRRTEIGRMLNGRGIKDPNTFFDLWGWYKRFKSGDLRYKRFKSGDLPTYASRRQFMSELYDPLLERLQQDGTSTPGLFEPTGWAKVDRTVTEIRQRLEQASTEEQFQTVGTLSREALISLAQAVFDADRHPIVDGVKVSPTDFKRMMEAYFAVELAGGSMTYSRQHAKAAFELANELQHKRTATFRHAALCAEATVAVINIVAIVSGRRDPS